MQTIESNSFRTAELFLRSLRIQIEQALASGASAEQIKTWLIAEKNRIPIQSAEEKPVSDR